ncbi:MAG: YbaB/EbfC family nucleoid-associated protein [Chloroflexota bacterium]
MAKRSKGFSQRPPQAGGMGGGMLQQLQKLQEEMVRTQEALGEETLSITAGGGAIEVVITGHQRIQSITIAPDVVDPDDVEMLQDLIIVAVNEAIEASQKLSADRLGGLTGGLGMGLPGLFSA